MYMCQSQKGDSTCNQCANIKTMIQDAFDHGKGTENLICNFGEPSPLDFFEFSPVGFFACFSSFCVFFSKEIALKCGENCPIPRRSKKRRSNFQAWLLLQDKFRAHAKGGALYKGAF